MPPFSLITVIHLGLKLIAVSRRGIGNPNIRQIMLGNTQEPALENLRHTLLGHTRYDSPNVNYVRNLNAHSIAYRSQRSKPLTRILQKVTATSLRHTRALSPTLEQPLIRSHRVATDYIYVTQILHLTTNI